MQIVNSKKYVTYSSKLAKVNITNKLTVSDRDDIKGPALIAGSILNLLSITGKIVPVKLENRIPKNVANEKTIVKYILLGLL